MYEYVTCEIEIILVPLDRLILSVFAVNPKVEAALHINHSTKQRIWLTPQLHSDSGSKYLASNTFDYLQIKSNALSTASWQIQNKTGFTKKLVSETTCSFMFEEMTFTSTKTAQ